MHTVDELIELALREDIGSGDITTDATVSPDIEGVGDVIAKDDFILAGLDVARNVFIRLDPQVFFSTTFKDGDSVKKGRIVFSVRENFPPF
jgi:nicotinate-nucleotide pyrophosphorylase (carboxylating)